MSLDIYLKNGEENWTANITHNLGNMADHAGLYKPMWRPEELGINTAKELIPYLEKGLDRLEEDPEFFEQFDPSNGWGSYDNLVGFTIRYLRRCQRWPDAKIEVSR